MKMQKSVIFVKKNLKINMPQIKNIVKLAGEYRHAGEYRSAAQVTRTNKNGKKPTKTISYRLPFIDSARFMGSS